ncbi:hypothetical protein [uncultured Duncaniella sp.]|nr:hypothetical protein [uncultured Duncaniella sp.]
MSIYNLIDISTIRRLPFKEIVLGYKTGQPNGEQSLSTLCGIQADSEM